ncbi:MAG: hypothetical protein ACRDL2_11615 [Gaiellaceae bacterium]
MGETSADLKPDTTMRVNVAPPSVDRAPSIVPVTASSPANEPAMKTSVPSASSAGCVPTRTAAAFTGADHVTPPSSLDWLTVSFLASSVYRR